MDWTLRSPTAMRAALLGAAVLASAACTEKNGPADGSPARYTWWQDVQPIVAARCQLCHAAPPQFGAPASLVSYADTQQLRGGGVPMHTLMAMKVTMRVMPPAGQPKLTDEERELIATWSANGAPEGTPPTAGDAGVPGDAAQGGDDAATTPAADAGTPGGDDASAGGDATPATDAGATAGEDAGGTVGSDASAAADAAAPSDAGTAPTVRTLDFLAHDGNGGGAYPLPRANTSYICWAFTVPASMATEEHAVRFEPVIDNAAYIHHMLLFRNNGSPAQAGPFDCTSWPLAWNMVAGWAPGRMADEIPSGAGVTLHPGDQLVLQAHYNNVPVPTETDQSGMRVTLTDEPNLTPAGMMWAGPAWARAMNGSNVMKSSTCTLSTPITVFSVFPHMHQTGTRITLEVQRAGQSGWTTLVDIDPWSFADQPNVAVDPGEQLMGAGDRLRTTCWWNTMGRSISYGEASNDEMCFNFLYHYPLVSNQYACLGFSP